MACWQSGLFALGWVALVPFFYSLQGLDKRQRWRQGYLAGFICYSLINWWIIPTVTRAAPVIGVPNLGGFFLGLLAVALIAAIHGVLVAIVALLWEPENNIFGRVPAFLPLATAVLWALLDAARCETILAHGWGALAYTQARNIPLLNVASWAGQHGLTAVCVWFAASLALWAQRPARRKSITGWVIPVAVLAVLHIGGLRGRADAVTSDSLRVLIVQTNADSLGKNFATGGEGGLQQAIRLTREAKRDSGWDIIVWPETTVAAGRLAPHSRNRPGYEAAVSNSLPVGASLELQEVAALSREMKTPILFGANATQLRTADQPAGLRNTAMLVDPDGRVQWTAKSRLVPFGEKAPFGDQIPFLKILAPRPEVLGADEPQLLTLKRAGGAEVKVGAVICFESCFPNPARALARRGAQALFILTNDDWFAGTDAPAEHAAMGALRAVENKLPVAQSANGGYSGAIGPDGSVIAMGRYGVPGTIEARLPIAH